MWIDILRNSRQFAVVPKHYGVWFLVRVRAAVWVVSPCDMWNFSDIRNNYRRRDGKLKKGYNE
jgi:hypothetical protein